MNSLKTKDIFIDGLEFRLDDNNHSQCLNTTAQGDDFNQRVGQDILIRHLHIHGYIINSATTDNASCRLLIYNDKAHNKSGTYRTQGFLLNDVGDNTAFNAHQSPWTSGTIRFLYDSTFDVQSRNNAVTYAFDIQVPNLNIITSYDNAADNITSITSNAIILEIIESQTTTLNTLVLEAQSRIYYVDA